MFGHFNINHMDLCPSKSPFNDGGGLATCECFESVCVNIFTLGDVCVKNKCRAPLIHIHTIDKEN